MLVVFSTAVASVSISKLAGLLRSPACGESRHDLALPINRDIRARLPPAGTAHKPFDTRWITSRDLPRSLGEVACIATADAADREFSVRRLSPESLTSRVGRPRCLAFRLIRLSNIGKDFAICVDNSVERVCSNCRNSHWARCPARDQYGPAARLNPQSLPVVVRRSLPISCTH